MDPNHPQSPADFFFNHVTLDCFGGCARGCSTVSSLLTGSQGEYSVYYTVHDV